jgi:hypothetical protein
VATEAKDLRMTKAVIGTILVLSAMLVAPGAAVADDTRCIGALPADTYDNIIVPRDSLCVLQGSVVRGSIKIEQNARLVAIYNEIRGNVEGDKAELLQMTANTVGGNVFIEKGETPGDGGFDIYLCGNTLTQGNIQVEKIQGSIVIGDPEPSVAYPCAPNNVQKGNIKLEKNLAVPFAGMPTSGLVIRGNQVGGNLQVFKNEGPASKTIQGNVVNQDLQCFENDPVVVGGPNFAAKAEGQCF